MQESKLLIHNYKKEGVLHKIEIGRKFWASFKEPFTFDRLQIIDLPSRGSIASLQANVQGTRMGHGKKKAIEDTRKEISERPPLKHTSHKLVSIAKQKRAIFSKILKVTCDICSTKTMAEKNDEVVTCDNYDRILKVE